MKRAKSTTRRALHRFRAGLTFAGILLPPAHALGVASADTVSSELPALGKRVLAFVSKAYPAGVPYERGRDLGAVALPSLNKMPEHNAQKSNWVNVVSAPNTEKRTLRQVQQSLHRRIVVDWHRRGGLCAGRTQPSSALALAGSAASRGDHA